ncbi:MAG: dTDP-4-amino-4,6-dideoxygalactose transaminase [Verrucomicrobia bacterium]|nr:MAG: dTDP-4-amino-4,6-dideoxygalactose transaminase [Verrucomicrobiota bacterium]
MSDVLSHIIPRLSRSDQDQKIESANFSVPFNRSSLEGRELEYIFQAITSGQISGGQTFSKRCELLLEQVLGVKRALITTSCTHALEMCALLLNIQPGDEIITTSFTFVSTVNAFVLRGATPIFCDIRADTLNIDENKLEALITPNTKAIVPIHYSGIACEMDQIVEVANRYDIPIIEDNAHGLFGKYKKRYLGTIGCLATQSFHETKNITCGEGGALLINDPHYLERAEIICEKGTDRSRFFRGQVDKYTWIDVGSSYVISDVLAAFLFAQLEVRQKIQFRRQSLWERYHFELAEWACFNNIRQPFIPPECDPGWHLYYLILPSLEQRQALISHLKAAGILAVFHYHPLHLSEMGRKLTKQSQMCPVCEDIHDRILRLPFYNSMTDGQQTYILETLLKFSCG